MSMELMTKAFKIKVGNPLRKLILIKLADNASDKGECWPSFQHIADQCEISRRSVINHIDALCDCGLLKKELRAGVKGNASNLYYLTLDGAGDSLGGSAAYSPPSAGDSPPSAGDSPPSAGDSPGGSAGAAPRISHSFESVIESVKEPNSIGAQADASPPAQPAKQEYSPEFEQAWRAYPKRAGGNPKHSAYKSWNARLREKVTPADMLAGVHRYAAYLTSTGKIGTEFVKQAATFFGPDRHFDEAWLIQSTSPTAAARPLVQQGAVQMYVDYDALRRGSR
ncbi:helix-turn-helix domain-containing protein [Rouxiella badensis]|uniref:helix-turn-helix domain-containing protein n=1 Tax=Rouxiella badensis TaxID=1646377 RepID=UPI0013EF59EE|nr:helix-turn-helix domain-containing protein [Rouxiella badensis]QII37491.1 helix-turn-helix domain-containing protein [Rouxiella badensis]